MTTPATITQLGGTGNLGPDYHVVIRDLRDGHDVFEWTEFDGRRMDYPAARVLLLGLRKHLPALRGARACTYVMAEPVKP